MNEPSLIDALESALSTADPDKREAVLDHVTDLFAAGCERYSDAQVALFDNVFLKLSRDIETQARRRLSQRLATLGHVPINTVIDLARDPSPAVASPVLRNVLELDDSDIVAVAMGGSDEHLLAIADRPALAETVTSVLVERGGDEVARAVAGNPGAHFSEEGFSRLVSRAGADPVLAEAVGSRHDIPRDQFAELVRNASAAVRVRLVAANPVFAREIIETVGNIVGDIGRRAKLVSDDPEVAKFDVARLLHGERSGDIDTAAAALARKFDQATHALSLLGHVPLQVAERAFTEDKPEMLIIIARAGGLSWKSLKGMLRIHNGDRDVDIDNLLRMRQDFEHLHVDTARQVLARYLARAGSAG
jgi:uncharacterized protein (DUF2336 family)